MSELTLFKSGASLPDYLRADPDEFTKRLAGGSAGKSISIKGGVWRMIVGGEEIAKNEDRAMNVVVVNAAPAVSRTYYEGAYEEGAVTSPACFSADGKFPDAAIKARRVLPALHASRTLRVPVRATLGRAGTASALLWCLKATWAVTSTVCSFLLSPSLDGLKATRCHCKPTLSSSQVMAFLCRAWLRKPGSIPRKLFRS